MFTGGIYSCHNPIILDRLLWSLASCSIFIFFCRTFPWLLAHYHNWRLELKRRSQRGKQNKIFQHHNYSFLAHVSLQTSLFSQSIACCYRAASNENMGVDLKVSMVFLVWFWTYMPSDAYIRHRTLTIFCSSIGNNKTKMDQLIEFHGKMTFSTFLIAFVGLHICVVIGILLPPEPTLERLLITLFRNVSILCMFLAQWFTDTHMLNQLKKSKQSVTTGDDDGDDGGGARTAAAASTTENDNNNNNSTSNDNPSPKSSPKKSSQPPTTAGKNTPPPPKMTQLIQHLEQVVLQSKRLLGFFTIMLIIFNGIPMLYPFQYVLYSFMNIISVSKSHPINFFKRNTKSKNKNKNNNTVQIDDDHVAVVVENNTNQLERNFSLVSSTGIGGVGS
jgi:hypothetical protein